MQLEGTVTVPVTALPRLPRACTHTRNPALQEIVDRLHGLTAASLPLALAPTILNNDDWRGLGLLSGSRLSDIATALGLFCTRYDSSRRLAPFQAALPGSTEQDVEWLVSKPAARYSPMPAPLSQLHWQVIRKSAASVSSGRSSEVGRASKRVSFIWLSPQGCLTSDFRD